MVAVVVGVVVVIVVVVVVGAVVGSQLLKFAGNSPNFNLCGGCSCCWCSSCGYTKV